MQRMVLIALSLLLSLSYGALLAGRGIAEAKSTVEIDISSKQYQPPAMTPVIPQALEEKGFRLAVHAGDTLKICNHDQLIMKPFSLNKGFTNFTAPGGQLKPGQCMTYVVNNNGDNPALFQLFDELHARNKLFVVVLPKKWPNQGEEKTPPDRRNLVDPTAEYALTANGTIVEQQQIPCASPVGTWHWWDGSTVTFKAGGSADHSAAPGQPGTWQRVSSGDYSYKLYWPKWKSTDKFNLSGDTMDGNFNGTDGTSTRKTPC